MLLQQLCKLLVPMRQCHPQRGTALVVTPRMVLPRVPGAQQQRTQGQVAGTDCCQEGLTAASTCTRPAADQQPAQQHVAFMGRQHQGPAVLRVCPGCMGAMGCMGTMRCMGCMGAMVAGLQQPCCPLPL
eukprot:CAMPEP_0202898696 /NCGR_PEP_ID=MMETSP1392-20130828/7152_1 /ASSEMBLY_ACC=CAM_ASM_000868 /TAXON_ID=225041 /ORGANISM="Chlamydomonas chlamydogama, Strain SAG 11-48b" /LENGTH=128 /DNA_ID=CAMNT_0049584697 /DNA_START=644 /DNA_END=1026 /DNA_ORIENTATION=+